MAIAKLNEPFSAVSGAFGGESGVVAMPDKNGRTLLRNNVIPNQPNSSLQVSARVILSQVAATYRALTEAQANAWDQAAALITLRGRLDQEYKLQGMGLYMRTNWYRVADGQAIVSVPPTTEDVVPPTLTSVDDEGVGVITVNLASGSGAGTGFYFVKISGDLNSTARKARLNECVALGDTYQTSIVPIAAGNTTATGTKPTLNSGDRVGVLVEVLNTGYLPVSTLFVTNTAIVSP